VPRHIGPYQLERVLGRGGLGVVHRAVDTRSGRRVALKLLQRPETDGSAAGRMSRELRVLQGLVHPNIVRVLDGGVCEQGPYIVMEYVDGLGLRSWLEVDGPVEPSTHATVMRDDARTVRGDDEPDTLPAHLRLRPAPAETVLAGPLPAHVREALARPLRRERLRSALRQLALGLSFVHEHGLVHRDLKPTNVLVDQAGVVKLADFGLVKDTHDPAMMTAPGQVVGTYRYMSPEQARGEPVDARSDWYAFGAVLYELLCGRPVFPMKQPAQLVDAILNRPPVEPVVLVPEVEPALAGLAMRLLAKAPGGRPGAPQVRAVLGA
jgi:serine/threonine protein kinase